METTTNSTPPEDTGVPPPAPGSAPTFHVKDATHAGVWKFEDGRELAIMRSAEGWAISGRWGDHHAKIALTHEAMDIVVGAVVTHQGFRRLRVVHLQEMPNTEASNARARNQN